MAGNTLSIQNIQTAVGTRAVSFAMTLHLWAKVRLAETVAVAVVAVTVGQVRLAETGCT